MSKRKIKEDGDLSLPTSLPARSSKVAQVRWAGPSRASARRCVNSRRDRSLKDSLSASSAALATFARRSSSVGDGARFPRPMPFFPIINCARGTGNQ
jgi:hypothetical protein